MAINLLGDGVNLLAVIIIEIQLLGNYHNSIEIKQKGIKC